jgi:predicted metal-dependent HD superfamily phosphohydrolase
VAVLEKVDELAQEASCPCLVRLAAFYHGAVLSTDLVELGRHTWGEDEAQSAELAFAQLTHLGLAEAKAKRVAELVSKLGARPALVKDPDLAVLCDAERSILAADPRTYRAYAQALRDECADSPISDILSTRISVLRRWLALDRLFLTAATGAWEGPARNNIRAELARCVKELAQISAPV